MLVCIKSYTYDTLSTDITKKQIDKDKTMNFVKLLIMNNIQIDTKSQKLLRPHSTKKSLGTKRIFIPKSMKSSLPIKYIQISSQNSHIIYFFFGNGTLFILFLFFFKFREFSLHNLTINRKMHVRRPLMNRLHS